MRSRHKFGKRRRLQLQMEYIYRYKVKLLQCHSLPRGGLVRATRASLTIGEGSFAVVVAGTWHVHTWVIGEEVEGTEVKAKHFRRHPEANIQ